MRFLRIIGKIVLIIAVIVIILFSLLSFFLFTDFGHQKIIGVVNEKLIHGEIKFEKLSLNLRRLSVEIKNVVISPPDEKPVISVGNLKTAVSLRTLVLQKRILVKYMEINDVIVNIDFDENGHLGIEKAFVNPDDIIPEDIDWESVLDNGILDLFANILEIKNAEVNFALDGILVNVSGLNLLALNIDLRELSLDLQLNSNNSSAKIEDMNFALDTLSLKLNGSRNGYNTHLINLDEIFAVSSVKDTILLSAVVKNPRILENFNLNLTANSSLNSLQNYKIEVLPENSSLSLRTKINLKGTLQHPVANIKIDANDIDILGYSADKITSNIYIDNETLITENLSAKNIRAQNFSGDVFLNASAKLRPFFPNGLIGGFDSTALTIENISAKADAKVSVRENPINEVVNLTAKAELRNAVANLDYLHINAKNREILEITGTYGIKNERISANIKVLPTNIADFNDILNTPVENAVISANANIGGTISKPQISATALVRDIRAFDIWANRIDISANFAGDIANFGSGSGNLAINLDTLTSDYQNISRFSSNISIKDSTINLENLSFFIGEDDSVQLSGKYQLNGEYSADLSIPNLSLSDISLIAEQPIFGRGRVAVTAAGNISENPLPRTANVLLEIDTIDYAVLNDLGDFGLATHQNLYLKIENNQIFPSANGIISIDGGKILFNEKGEVKILQVPVLLADAAKAEINGEISGEEIAIKAGGEIILERFTHFAAEFLDSVKGAVNFAVEIGGKTASPSIQASVNLREISGNIILLEQKFHSLSGEIFYKNDGVEIQKLSGKIDGANGDKPNFAVSGNIDLTNPSDIHGNAVITLENLHLSYPDMAAITIDGNILGEFTQNGGGGVPSAKLHGTIDILNAVYFQDIDMSILNIAGITNRQGAFENLGGAVSLRRQRTEAFSVDLDLLIRPRGSVAVANNLAELSLIPDISVGGTTQFPTISGRVRVSDGEVFFNNNTFEVRQGIIDFTDPYSIRPEVEISAETTIHNYRITLEISGDPQEELFFGFTSQPNLSDQDILSLILFGRILSELDEFQGDAINMLINNMLGGAGPRGMEIAIIDGDVSVSLARNLSRQFSVGYTIEAIGGEAVQTGILSWKISDFLRLRAYTDTRNQAGVGLEAEFERR